MKLIRRFFRWLLNKDEFERIHADMGALLAEVRAAHSELVLIRKRAGLPPSAPEERPLQQYRPLEPLKPLESRR
jgi:hypothetical protein